MKSPSFHAIIISRRGTPSHKAGRKPYSETMGKIKRTIKAYVRFFQVRGLKAKTKKDKAYIALVLPWILILRHFRKDPTLIWHFGIWFLLVSCEVWFPYLMSAITWGTEASAWWAGIGSACWIFWLGPGTPFLAIVLGLSIGSSALWRRMRDALRRRKKTG